MPLAATPQEQDVLDEAMIETDVPTVELLAGEDIATVADAGNPAANNTIVYTVNESFIVSGLDVRSVANLGIFGAVLT